MKKITLILLLILMLVLAISACNQNSTASTTSSTNKSTSTTVRPSGFGHDDNDNDGICDNCGGKFVDSKCMGAKCAEEGEHVWGEYQYNEQAHWREYVCGHEWPEIAEEHVDIENDRVCDICGYDWNPKAIWCYDDKWHWMIYDSTYGPVPDIVWGEGEHTFENDGVKCDKCPYCRHIDGDENNSCDVCGDDFTD